MPTREERNILERYVRIAIIKEGDRAVLEKFNGEEFGVHKYVQFDISFNSNPLKETAVLTDLYWDEIKKEE